MIYDIVIQYKEIFLKRIPDIAYILKIYDIILQHQEMFVWNIYQTDITYTLKDTLHSSSLQSHFFQTYTRYNLYFKDIWYNCSTQRKVLKHIPDITFTLNIYDTFEMCTRWNIYTNQMKIKNYTSWNIETKPMTLETYTSRCRKLHLKLSTLPTCSNGWN